VDTRLRTEVETVCAYEAQVPEVPPLTLSLVAPTRQARFGTVMVGDRSYIIDGTSTYTGPIGYLIRRSDRSENLAWISELYLSAWVVPPVSPLEMRVLAAMFQALATIGDPRPVCDPGSSGLSFTKHCPLVERGEIVPKPLREVPAALTGPHAEHARLLLAQDRASEAEAIVHFLQDGARRDAEAVAPPRGPDLRPKGRR
jgi:hypothetical protein